MGSNKDGNPITVEKNKDGSIKYSKEDGSFAIDEMGKVLKQGSDDAKTLAKTYRELAKDGFSDEDNIALAKLDATLKGAKVIHGTDSHAAHIIDGNNKSYMILSEKVLSDFKSGKGGRE